MYGVHIRLHDGKQRCSGIDGVQRGGVSDGQVRGRELVHVVRRGDSPSAVGPVVVHVVCGGSIRPVDGTIELYGLSCGLVLSVSGCGCVVRVLELLLR